MIYFLVVLVFCGGGKVLAGEFQPDEHTLFLCHYNSSLDADYAKGDPRGMGKANLTSGGNGYFGEGLVASKKYKGEIQGIVLGFKGLSYDISKNLNLDEGTLEMWVNLLVDLEKMKGTRRVLFRYRYVQQKKVKRQVMLYIGENLRLIFYESKGGDNWASQTCAGTINWKKGEWHHIAVTWSKKKGEKALFVDGVLQQKGPFRGLPEPSQDFPKMYIGSGTEGGIWALEGIIDEFRISNIVRYTDNFILPERDTTQTGTGK